MIIEQSFFDYNIWEIYANVLIHIEKGRFYLKKYRWRDFDSFTDIDEEEFKYILNSRDKIMVVNKDKNIISLHKFDLVEIGLSD